MIAKERAEPGKWKAGVYSREEGMWLSLLTDCMDGDRFFSGEKGKDLRKEMRLLCLRMGALMGRWLMGGARLCFQGTEVKLVRWF